MKIIRIATVALAFITTAATAEPISLTIGSGGEGGTYYPVVEEMAQFCNSPNLTISHYTEDGKSVGGSIANLEHLTHNKAQAGIVQLDVAYLQKGTNPALARIQALLPLHAENLHFIVPMMANVMVRPPEEAKATNLWQGSEAVFQLQQNPLASIQDLTGRRVVAWGGSVVSAKVVSQQTGYNFQVLQAKDRAEAMAMISSGQADAVLAVAGYPVDWIGTLPAKQYKLLSVPAGAKAALAAVYDMAGVSYNNLGATGQTLETLKVDAVLMTRTYRTPKMIEALSELKSCLQEKIYEIQDTPGTHAAWQGMDLTRDMKWDNVFTSTAGRAVPRASVQLATPAE